LNQSKEQTQTLEKTIKDQNKEIEALKESIYEHENRNTDIELQMEDLKTNLEVANKQLTKDLKTTKDNEADLNKKYEALQKKYDAESKSLMSNQESNKMLMDEKIETIETQLKETQDSFEMAKQTWDKEKAVLN